MFSKFALSNVSFKQIDNIYFSTLSIARYLMIFDISYISFFDANHFIALCRLLDMSTTECVYFFFGNLLGSFFFIKIYHNIFIKLE